jgi:nitroreductase
MDVVEAIHTRHSVRAFTPQPVARETIDLLVSAAAAAPSAQNSQPWHFHVATGETRRRVGELIALTTVHLSEYVDMLGPEGVRRAEKFYADLGGAPVVIALSVPKSQDESWRANEYLSAGAAIENLLLAALQEGLGACNITAPHWVLDDLHVAFAVPEDREIASLILLGHPAERPFAPVHREDVSTILD